MRFIDTNCRRSCWALVLIGASSAACAAESNPAAAVASGAAAASGKGSAGTATSGGAGVLGSSNGGTGPGLVLDVGGSPGSMPPTGDGAPESCDGKDNDSNGIVDDVDVGGDGICDCLNIATVGVIGPWSNGGNVFAAWLAARSPIGVTQLRDEPLTPERLAPFQVIVTLHVATVAATSEIGPHHPFSESEVAAVDAWVKSGGGLMTTIGYTGTEVDEVVNVNRLLMPLGLGYSTTLTTLDGPVQTWVPHPITEGVTNVRTDNGVEPVVGTLLAQDTMNRQALSVGESGQGRAVVWGDEWITYDSEWADVDGQQVERMWLNLFKWLSPPHACQVPTPDRVK